MKVDIKLLAFLLQIYEGFIVQNVTSNTEGMENLTDVHFKTSVSSQHYTQSLLKGFDPFKNVLLFLINQTRKNLPVETQTSYNLKFNEKRYLKFSSILVV